MKDLLVIVAIAAGCATIVGLIVIGMLRLLRRRSIVIQVAVVAAGAVAATISGTVGVARAMFLSTHDLAVELYVSATAGVVAIAMSFALSRWVAHVSRGLTSATRTLGDGAMHELGDQPRGAELAQLADELAATSSRLAESREREQAMEQSRRELIAWISHDLRTPLAGLRATAEALEDGVTDDPDRYHRQIRSHVDRMAMMVDDLFELSRIQSGMLALTFDTVGLHDLVSDVIADFGPVAKAHRVQLAGQGDAVVTVLADSREMMRALSNVLINAIRHTPADGTVAIVADQVGDRARLTVTDGCGGIPEAELPRVFDAGWRGNGSRSPSELSGAGLGLTIVNGIVAAHDGKTAVSNVADGCQFEILLPIVAR